MKLLKWIYRLFLMLGAWCLPISNVYATPLPFVDCNANILTNPINISNTITSANVGSAKINATLEYKCRSLTVGGYVSVCLAANGGNSNPTNINPRYMINRTDNTSTLPFQMTIDDSIWGTGINSGSEHQAPPLYVPWLFGGSRSGSVPITVSLVANTDGTLPTAGLYSTVFSGLSATLTFDADTNQNEANCLTDRRETKSIETFTVQATVVNSCEITTTNDVNLGAHPASNTNILGSRGNAIGVTCTKDAPYTIGLTPSNGNQAGLGVMSGNGSNDGKVPYQLRSTSGLSGTKWNSNGVTRTGSGAEQLESVYVTVPSADFKPDTYTDTVTIHVNY